MRAFFDHSEPAADSIMTFWFRPEQSFSYLAGQYVNVELPGSRRWFTLSSSPSEAPLVSITTKLGRSPFKLALAQLKPNDVVQLSEPIGDFVLPKDASIPLVFVAAGIGITPVRSMVKFLLDSNERRSIKLIYAVSQPEDFAFLALFENYNLKPSPIVTKPSPDWRAAIGQLTGRRILAIAKPAENAMVYLSGPEPMVEALRQELINLKINPARLVTDLFTGYSTI